MVSYAQAPVDLVEQSWAQVGELFGGDGGLWTKPVMVQQLSQVQALGGGG